MQTTMALQKKEQNKDVTPSLRPPTEFRGEPKEEHAAEAGVPLFLLRPAVSFSSTPPPVQRQPDDEDTEQFLQTKPTSDLIQRDLLEEDEDMTTEISGPRSVQREPLKEQAKNNNDQPGVTQFQRHPDDQVAEDNEEVPVFQNLTIGAPNDKYEQEAERVSDAVMRMPEESGIGGQNRTVRRKPT
jgi:hypothetical protein